MRRGFSLVELLIALTIIMAVVATAAGIFQPLVAEQQVEVLKANLRLIRQSLIEFYNDNGRYPYEGQDEFGNVVTFLDDSTSELVQGPHSGQGRYPDTEPDPARRGARRRYLLAIPGDPTLEGNQIGWKLIFRETFNINSIPEAELKKISGFDGSLSDWIASNRQSRPFRSPTDLVNRLSDNLKPQWGQAFSAHDVRFSGAPLRTRMVTNVKSLNGTYQEL